MKKAGSIYQSLAHEAAQQMKQGRKADAMDLAKMIRRLREEKKISGAALCRQAGDLDPRTLNALEKGRVKNPSLQTLQSVARGLGLSVADFFRENDLDAAHQVHTGSQKGAYQIDLPQYGIRVVSFTPFIKDFFCGKFIFGPHKKMDQTLLRQRLPIFLSVLVGRFEVQLESRKIVLKEGENLFFNGNLRHSFSNPLERESVFLIMTAPSFF